jgi:putative tryptophan/tyrosine transport system substrate-binding protein
MRRRNFIALLGGAAAAWPLVVRAQQVQPMKKLAILADASEAETRPGLAAFRQELERAGWSEGRNLQSTVRWADGRYNQIPAVAAEIVKMNPDLIVAWGGTGLRALLREAVSIPVVFAFADPIATGAISNMAHPGGNATGFTTDDPGITTKWLQLLKELVPGTRRLLVLNPENPEASIRLAHLEKAIGSFGVEMTSVTFADAVDIERGIETAAREPQTAMIVLGGSSTNSHRDLIVGLAARHRLPAIYATREFVAAGGLMAYGTDRIAFYRLTAGYANRILRGEKPGDLPMQAPTKYELAINVRTAKLLGLDVPPILLALADEVIE